MKKLAIIDGKSVYYRGYYAMGALSTKDGMPTGGVYGFAAIAMELIDRIKPDTVVVAWDSKTSTAKRKEIYKDYKAGRVKPPEDFYAQIPLLKELVEALNWNFVECDNYEADDIIGTLSKQAECSANPSRVASLEPAVAGLGRSSSAVASGSPSKELPEHNHDTIKTYIISSDLDMLQVVDENTRMYRLLKGFSELEEVDVAAVEKKYGILKKQFLDLKALKGDSSDNIPGVPGIGEKGAVKLLNEFGDLDGIYANIDKISGAIKTKLEAGKESAYMSKELAKIMFDAPVKLEEMKPFELEEDKVVAALKKLEFYSLISKFGLKVGQKTEEVEQKELPKDLIVAADVKSLMHEDKAVAAKILMGAEFWDLGQGKFLLDPLNREKEIGDKAAEFWRQKKEFEKEPELYKIFKEFDQPLTSVLYKMEKVGMLIDVKYFEQLKTEFEQKVKSLEETVWELSGRNFNVNSPVQLSEVLFSDLKLSTKGVKKTARGYSTGVKELERLRGEHPVIDVLMEYRETAKLLSTYITPMLELRDENDRIHTTFTQNVTATGRLSSLSPNLQNIPVRTEEGKRIREGFVADKGKKLVSADYSQFELRLAAVLSGDENLIKDFNAGIDIHTKTASEAFGVPFDKVTKAQRRAAKVINFGVLYGMSAKGLADAAGMTVMEAKAFIDKYFELRKPMKDKLEEILKDAREKGYVQTFYGRKRPTPDVKSSNFLIRSAAERAAQNMPIQGTEADLMKKAMIKVDAELPAGAALVMQVHDSLIVECDENLVDEVSAILKKDMENIAPELKVKLMVDVSVGNNWGEL